MKKCFWYIKIYSPVVKYIFDKWTLDKYFCKPCSRWCQQTMRGPGPGRLSSVHHSALKTRGALIKYAWTLCAAMYVRVIMKVWGSICHDFVWSAQCSVSTPTIESYILIGKMIEKHRQSVYLFMTWAYSHIVSHNTIQGVKEHVSSRWWVTVGSQQECDGGDTPTAVWL